MPIDLKERGFCPALRRPSSAPAARRCLAVLAGIYFRRPSAPQIHLAVLPACFHQWPFGQVNLPIPNVRPGHHGVVTARSLRVQAKAYWPQVVLQSYRALASAINEPLSRGARADNLP